VFEQPAEVVDHEVTDPDGPDVAVSEQRLQRPVGLHGLVELRRESLVEDQQVDLIDAELARTLLEAMQSFVVSVVTDPDLGLDKDLRSLEARVPDSLAHLPLVAVRRGCVHVLVAVSERRLDCGPRLLRRRLEDPKTEGRQVDTVI
jgi:hypothetical protein